MVTDTYPDERRRQHLYILDVKSNRAVRIASFHTPKEYRGDWRCDLHPRWSRDGTQVCIDSTHDGVRQVYVIDLAIPAPAAAP
jgi:Tol biopolymer transport system component